MKKIALTLMMILVLALPAYAQLGDTDNSSFVIQNLGANDATVTVIFYQEDGTHSSPNPLLPGPDGVCGDANDIPTPLPWPDGQAGSQRVVRLRSGLMAATRSSSSPPSLRP